MSALGGQADAVERTPEWPLIMGWQFPDCSVDIINLEINNDARRCGYRFHFVDGKSIARICFETRVSRRAIDDLL